MKTVGQTAVELCIDSIVVNGRHRKQMGDLQSLANSIDSVGLLHPVVVDEKRHLIAGHRRIEAYRLLEREKIPVTVARNFSDVQKLLIAERDENTERLDFSPTEALSLQQALLPMEREEAAKRKSEGGKTGRRNRISGTKKASGKKPEAKAAEKSAAATGYSEATLRKIKEVQDSGYADLVERMDKTGKVDRAYREMKRRQDREAREREASEASKELAGEDCGVVVGDFREVAKNIADESVSLIFTDPPYDRESLPLYGDMAAIASRVLIPGGSLICYLGQYQIDEVCKLVSPHLRLWWTLACIHTGTSARMTEYGIVVKWKPMLWFVKGTRGDKQTFVDDAIVSQQEKSHHDWQQSVKEAGYYIDKLTISGELVFDPFCGGGTTSVAAKKLGRRWATCDVDSVAATFARKRVRDCD